MALYVETDAMPKGSMEIVTIPDCPKAVYNNNPPFPDLLTCTILNFPKMVCGNQQFCSRVPQKVPKYFDVGVHFDKTQFCHILKKAALRSQMD